MATRRKKETLKSGQQIKDESKKRDRKTLNLNGRIQNIKQEETVSKGTRKLNGDSIALPRSRGESHTLRRAVGYEAETCVPTRKRKRKRKRSSLLSDLQKKKQQSRGGEGGVSQPFMTGTGSPAANGMMMMMMSQSAVQSTYCGSELLILTALRLPEDPDGTETT
ncbi:hypothetical protein EYF80_043276 [Liparis tanakae]|uniref:Uncharacterized protein n=1 Tax=Liparis tanakae TaxID=230148 RepID=A0A4Z2G1V9_9TELE|nr:hypothetical protein EYF80_043276 [Liparis tanakae]